MRNGLTTTDLRPVSGSSSWTWRWTIAACWPDIDGCSSTTSQQSKSRPNKKTDFSWTGIGGSASSPLNGNKRHFSFGWRASAGAANLRTTPAAFVRAAAASAPLALKFGLNWGSSGVSLSLLPVFEGLEAFRAPLASKRLELELELDFRSYGVSRSLCRSSLLSWSL